MTTILPYQRQTSDATGLGYVPQAQASPAIAQGLASVAGGLNAVGGAFEEQAQKQRAAQSALAMATLNNDLRDAHDNISQGIVSGDIPSDKAASTFQDQASTLRDKAFAGLSPKQQAQLSPDFVNTSGLLTRSLNTAVFQRSQSEAAATIDSFGEQAQRSALRVGPAEAADKYGAFVDFAGPQAGFSPEKSAKMKQTFSENVHYDAFQAAGIDALTKNDPDGLAEVRRQLQSSDGDALDPTKRAVLTRQLYGYEQSLLAKQDAAANAEERDRIARENAASAVYNQALDLATQGKAFDPGFIKTMTESAAGTSSEGDMNELLSKQVPIAGFATKTAPARAKMLNDFESAAVTTGTNPGVNKMLNGLKAIDSKLNEAVKTNAWGAARDSGVIDDATAFDASKPDSAFAIIQQRNQNIDKVEAWAGQKVSPFQPQEITQLAKAVKSLPPDQAGPYLGKLGDTIGDVDRINLVAAELDKSDHALSLAMKLGTDKTSAGRAVPQFVLEGSQALADKAVKRDDTVLSGWRGDIANQVRGTLGDNQMENDVIDAAYYTRAAMDKDGIEIPGYGLDKSNENAVKMVIGQPITRAGVKTILPRGIDENTFDAKLQTFTPQSLSAIHPMFYVKGNPVTPAQLAGTLTSLGMRRDGRGNYIPVSNGLPVTTDAVGTQPLRLTLP